MLAQNPSLTFADRQILWRDKDKYVRRAIAMNLRLSHEEMTMVLQKPTNTVLMGLVHKVFPYASSRCEEYKIVLRGLAGNPTVPQEVLLQVFDTLRKHGDDAYYAFSMNPNCPQKIIGEIMNVDNDRKPFINSNRDWVRRTQERKEQFRQAKAHGKPFPSGYYPWSHAELWWRDEDE